MLSNCCTVKPVNDLKSNGFLDNYSMKAKREQDNGDLFIIKLFSSNYAKDLLLFEYKKYKIIQVSIEKHVMK